MQQSILFLFDLDATLVRTGGAGMLAMNQAYEDCFGWVQALEYISPAGRTDTSIAHELSNKYQHRDMTEDEMEKVFSRYLVLLEEKLKTAEHFRVLPGISEFLEKASANKDHLFALGTGNLEKGARLKLALPDLNRYFPVGGFGSDAVLRSEVLELAITRTEKAVGYSLDRSRVIVIGDTPHDIQAGKAIGAKTLGVATGPFSAAQLAEYQPDLVLSDFSQTIRLDAFLKTF